MDTNKNLPSMPTPPPDVMGDPIAHLDWLEKNADGITEQDPRGNCISSCCCYWQTPPPVGSHLRHIGLGDGVVTHISQSSLDGVGVYVSAEFGSALRSFAFPYAFESGTVELLGE